MTHNQYIHFISRRVKTFELGEHYLVYGRQCKLIQVTAKGFNFLDIVKNKCVLKSHVYDVRYSGKPLPKNLTSLKLRVPYTINNIPTYKEA